MGRRKLTNEEKINRLEQRLIKRNISEKYRNYNKKYLEIYRKNNRDKYINYYQNKKEEIRLKNYYKNYYNENNVIKSIRKLFI